MLSPKEIPPKYQLNQKSGYTKEANVQSQCPVVMNIEHYRNIFASPENFIKRKVDYSRMKVSEEKYRKESERIKSFTEFPKNLSHLVKSIARSGFYFIGNKTEPDKVKCIYCQGILSNWKKSDKPVNEHKKFFPTCPFLLNLNVGNESKIEKGKIPDEDPDCIFGQKCKNVVKSDMISEFDDDVEICVEWREKTFLISKKFDHLKHLSLNGLFIEVTNEQEYVKCYKCRKSVELLRGVESLDSTLFHYRNCDFVATNKVEDHIISQDKDKSPISSNNHKKQTCRVEFAITNEEVEARLESIKINEVTRSIAIDRDVLKSVMETKLKSTGKDFEFIFDLVFDLKNHKEISEVKYSSNDLEAILCDYTCVICLDKPIEVVFLPCGHFRTCQSCSVMISSCPVCRDRIERRVIGIQLCENLDIVRQQYV